MSRTGISLKIIWGVIDDGTLKFKVESIFQQAILMAHPVGSIYESTDSTSPEVLFGGTWEAMNAGCVLVSSGTASTGTVYTAGTTGGEETHQLTESELPKVTPSFKDGGNALVFGGGKSDTDVGFSEGQLWKGQNKTDGAPFNSIGGDSPHNIMQPYEVVYRWKRIA